MATLLAGALIAAFLSGGLLPMKSEMICFTVRLSAHCLRVERCSFRISKARDFDNLIRQLFAPGGIFSELGLISALQTASQLAPL